MESKTTDPRLRNIKFDDGCEICLPGDAEFFIYGVPMKRKANSLEPVPEPPND